MLAGRADNARFVQRKDLKKRFMRKDFGREDSTWVDQKSCYTYENEHPEKDYVYKKITRLTEAWGLLFQRV